MFNNAALKQFRFPAQTVRDATLDVIKSDLVFSEILWCFIFILKI